MKYICFLVQLTNNIKHQQFPFLMKGHIFKHQTLITVFLCTLFVFLIALQIVYADRNFDTQFALIAGWLGIVIGFFFNQQMTAFFIEKYKQSVKEKQRIEEKVKEALKEYEAIWKEIEEKHKKFEEKAKIENQ